MKLDEEVGVSYIGVLVCNTQSDCYCSVASMSIHADILIDDQLRSACSFVQGL